MDKFIHGTIVEMEGEYGVYYELKLRLLNGEVIPVFYDNLMIEGPSDDNNRLKENDSISALLVINKAYDLIIVLRVQDFTYASAVPEGTVLKLIPKEFPRKGDREPFRRNDVRQAKVLDPDWNPSSLSYQAVATPKIFEQRYVLVETAVGQAVIKWATLENQLGDQAKDIAPGGYLEFSPVRLDILAIL